MVSYFIIMKRHTYLQSRQSQQQMGCDVLRHKTYSLDIVPSDFHLFRSVDTKFFNNVRLSQRKGHNTTLRAVFYK